MLKNLIYWNWSIAIRWVWMRLFPQNMNGILLLGWKSCFQDVKFQIYWVSKSIPAVKSQTFVDNSGAENFWNLIFLLKRQGYADITRTKINLWSYHLHTYYLTMKFSIKSYLLAQKQGKSEILLFFRKQYLTFATGRLFVFSGFIRHQGIMQVN